MIKQQCVIFMLYSESVKVEFMMSNYFNYMSQEDESIDTAQAFYIICLDSGLQRYKLVASPLALNLLQSDPETRIARYWPITREQIDNAPQAQIFDGDDICTAPFSLAQIQDFFDFDPQTITASQFGPPAPMQQQIPPLIQQAIQRAPLDAWQLSSITDRECIEAIQAGTFNLPWLIGRTGQQLEYITKPECIQAMQGPHPIFTMENLTSLDGSQLHSITDPKCIVAIQEEIVTIEQLSEMDIGDLKSAVESGNYPESGMSFNH